MQSTTTAGQLPHISIDGLKRLAKLIKKEQGIQHAKALDAAAQRHGFTNYANARRQIERRAQQ